jgi:hypothetical protein
MIQITKSIILFSLITTLFACSKKPQDIPKYAISKVIKTDSVTTVNVHIANRMTAGQLVLIAGKLRKDSAQILNLKICYLLPGNADITTGDNSFYASAKYIKDNEVTAADTVKDDEGKLVRLKIFGLSAAKAKVLLSMQPKEIAGKTILGKFIDDYNHTLIIPFNNSPDKKDELYVVEVDSSAKVVSATVPMKIMEGSTIKWQVTQHGDYMTIKDSILAQYAADGLGLPFNSIKSGI